GNACFLGSGDGALVLLKALAGAVKRVGRDDEEALCPLEGLIERSRIFKIGGADHYALRREIGERLGLARRGDDLVGWNLMDIQKVVDNKLAQMARRPSHEIHGSILPLMWSHNESRSQLECLKTSARRQFCGSWL